MGIGKERAPKRAKAKGRAKAKARARARRENASGMVAAPGSEQGTSTRLQPMQIVCASGIQINRVR